jgi:predicted Zn-dependent protease
MRGAPLLLVTILCLTACGTNPVTGEREVQFVSEAQEIKLGEQNYAPAQQSQGGDFDLIPELTSYVNSVGQKLAAVADRKLPYEFVVLDNSVPNAWALPGGKIAVNRGLLTALDNESELAAVLGHEIVHAAARHGAKAQERGTLMQAGLAIAQIGAAVGGVDQNVAGLVLQGAGVGAQMAQMKYGRDQELEADQYGMRYMKRAGYDPTGAVTLQEKFVKIANESAHKQSWLEGLFASHPPSTERVKQNRELLSQLGAGGEVGAKQYQAHVQPLMKMKPAFEKYDAALVAANKKDFDTARTLATEAVQLVPREGLFHQMLGDIAMAQKKPSEALPHYQKAIDRNPDYFGSYLGAGIAKLQLGDKTQAEQWLEKSAQLLPTAPAAYYLGTIEKDKGNRTQALEYYKAAASSDSHFGQLAASELIRMDLPQNPGNYIATAAQLDPSGRLILIVENRAPVALTGIQVTPVLIDNFGHVVREGSPVVIREVVNPNQRIAGDAGVGTVPPQQLSQVRFRVDGARVAE